MILCGGCDGYVDVVHLLECWWLEDVAAKVLEESQPEDDPDDPMRTALRQMVGVFAQLERGMITARLRSGRRTKAANGGFAGGTPPYGWRSENGELVERPEEQATLARIHEMKNARDSYETIAAKLNTDGVPPRRGKKWYAAAVARIASR